MTDDSTPDRAGGEPLIDTTVAHVARVYDYLLGGANNFEVDRAAAEATHEGVPGGIEASMKFVQANRRFLGRAVRWLAEEAGVRQFLDLGAGIPTEENVHQVAQRVAPESRIVYVDNDPVVLAYSHRLLTSTPEGRTRFVQADLRDTTTVLDAARAVLDFDEPIAVMLISMLHLFPDRADPYSVVPPYLDAVPKGSYLVLSHLARESDEMSTLGDAVEDNETMNYTLTMRTHGEVAKFFDIDGLELVDPGLVPIDDWHPTEAEEGGTPFHGGIARKL